MMMMGNSRHIARLGRSILLFGVLGAVTTYLVAIVVAYRRVDIIDESARRGGEVIVDPQGKHLPLPQDGKEPPNSMYMELALYPQYGVTFGMARLRPFQNYTPAAPAYAYPGPESIAAPWESRELLPWVHGERPWPDPLKGDSVWIKAAGWPLRATSSRIRYTSLTGGGHTWHARGGVIIGNPSKSNWADWPPTFARIIPLRPLWPGFAVDLVIYGLAWRLIIAACALIRRWRRRGAGLCQKCRYNLAGLPAGALCPECGTPGPRPPTPGELASLRARGRLKLSIAVGLTVTLLLAWPIPLVLLRLEWNKHQHGSRMPWKSPSGISCGVEISHLRFSDWYKVRPVRTEDSRALFGEPISIPSWVAYPPAPDLALYNIDTAATGWPFRAMTSESWLFRNPPGSSSDWTEELRGNLELLKLPSSRIILPLRPIWPGLLADIAVFSCGAWMLLVACGRIRRAARHRRGRCPGCGYDLSDAPPGAPCPECGERSSPRPLHSPE